MHQQLGQGDSERKVVAGDVPLAATNIAIPTAPATSINHSIDLSKNCLPPEPDTKEATVHSPSKSWLPQFVADSYLSLKTGYQNLVGCLGYAKTLHCVGNSLYLGANMFVNVIIIQGLLGLINNPAATFTQTAGYVIGYAAFQFLGVYLSSNVTRYQPYFELESEERSYSHLQSALLDKPYEQIKGPGLAGLVSAVSENNYRFKNCSDEFTRFIENISGISLSITYLMLFASPSVFAIAAVAACIPLVQNIHIAKQAIKDEQTITEPRRRNWWLRYMLVNHNASKDVRMLGVNDELQTRRSEATGIVKTTTQNRSHLNHYYNLFNNPVSTICSMAVIYLLHVGVQAGTIDIIPGLAVATFFYPTFVGLLSKASSNFGKLLEQAPHIKNYNKLVPNRNLSGHRAKKTTNTNGTSKPIDRIPERVTLELKNACYAYPDTSTTRSHRMVVNDVSLSVQPGQSLMICGDNGIGKSTLFEMLVGLRDPVTGTLKINDSTLEKPEDRKKWANNIGVCFQDFFLFGSLTFREILLLNANPVSNEYLNRVLDVTGITEILQETVYEEGREKLKFKLGLETVFGAEFVGGSDLSGGERQKFSIARALLRRPAVLFLDEFTSQLDPGRALEIYEFLADRENPKNMGYRPTVIFSSHDYRKARHAEHTIFFWKDENTGERHMAEGTFEELEKTNDLFKKKLDICRDKPKIIPQ